MACGGCKKAKKSFKRRMAEEAKRKIKKEAIHTELSEIVKSVTKPKKKSRKRGISKRGRWLRAKRRAERKAQRKS